MTQQTHKTSLLKRLLPTTVLRRPSNIFGMLIIVAGVAIVLRLVNVATFALSTTADGAATAGVTRSATAQEAATKQAVTTSDEEAPPLNQADVNRAVQGAAAVPAGVAAPETAAAPAAAEPAPTGTLAPTDGVEFSQTELDILQSLSKRREDLDMRERNLNESAAMLKAAEKEVDRKLSELNSLKAEIEKLLGTQEQVEEQRITSLVKIYEAMKPKEAATIFNTLDPDVLLSVVSRMNERRLSPILASMDPDKARMVTIRLAEQRQLPGSTPPIASAPPASGYGDAGGNVLDSPVLNLPDQLPADAATP